MNLSLYDSQLNRIAIIGDRIISCLWSEGYNTVQPFTMELQPTADYKKKVKPDCYVGRDDRKTLMVVKTVQMLDGHIVATGKQAARCLDDVPFIGTIPAGRPVGRSIKDAYDKGDGFEGFQISAGELLDTYDHEISNKSILALCEKMCQETDMGFQAVRGGGKVTVEFYKPEENPNLVFSERFGNLTVESVTMSTENWKNHAIVLGAGEGADRTQVEVDLSSGAQQRTLIVDARDITQEDGETEAAYHARLAARGTEKLLEKQRTWECAFTPLGKDFGTRYDLGDILTVHLQDYGITLKARVTRMNQKVQNNKTTTTIEVGTITIMR